MLKRYLLTIFIAVLIAFALSKNFQKFIVTPEETVFNLKHDYSSIAKTLNDNRNQIDENPSPIASPPLSPMSTSIDQKKNYNKLQTSMKKYLAKQQGTYGVYFLDLTEGQRMGLNANKNFIAASTIKVPINLYLYSMYSKNKFSIDDTVTYMESDYEEGTGDIQSDDFGNTYSLRELSRLSIEVSDNVAINMLSRYLDYEKVVEYMERLVNHAIPRDENVTTPRDMTLYLKSLLDLTQKHPKTHELLDFLLNTEYNDRIPLYLPPEVPIAHKIGNQTGAVHDAGIVFAQRPYILCLFSENVDEEAAPEVLAQISKMVYDYSQN